MNKFLILALTAVFFIGCSSQAQRVETNNTNVAVQKTNDTALVSSHSNDAGKTISPPSDKPSSNESSPMARAIDVSQMTADIEKAEKDPKNKEVLAKAYFTRAFALTEAAQYRAALGDFRKGLKLNQKDEDAKAMHDQILSIFKSINREPPKEGEEPPPLPFKKSE